MNLKDPNVQKIMLGVVAVIVVSYLYFGTEFMPFFYQVRKGQIGTTVSMNSGSMHRNCFPRNRRCRICFAT
jgi:hypothetical protein